MKLWKTILTTTILFVTFTLNAQESDNIRLANEYYSKGDVDKAKIMYKEISKDPQNIPLIHNNYFYILISTQDFKEADKYLNRLLKNFPGNLYYRLDKGLIYKAEGKEGTADKYFKSVIADIIQNVYLVRHASNYFVNNQLHEYSIYAFKQSRSSHNDEFLYSLELANLYRITGKRSEMVQEYLNYIISNPTNLRYVKNTLQNLLTETEELESLESILYDRIQKYPSNNVYPELLIWVNLQLKNFYGAFVQARALDKRQNSQGNKSIDIGLIALKNGDFKTASNVFSWIIENYPSTQNYYRSRMYLIQSYEMRVKNTYPIEETEIRNIIKDYDKLIMELGKDKNALEALRNKALLHAFYLDERDSAITILQHIISLSYGNSNVKFQSKLDLGDIYLLEEQPWESTLLYSQVEKERKDSPLAYDAKLKNAKLSYFRGEFLLAQEHLDIIKEATTREISNDAMNLSLLIKENIAFDSTEEAMKNYAAIELLLYRNKQHQALAEIEKMKIKYPGHSLTDELLWLEADIELKNGHFGKTISALKKIVADYPHDLLGDDAYFLIAEINEKHLNKKDEAMTMYFEFLKEFPGSVYAAEARKRYRTLRGDFENIMNE